MSAFTYSSDVKEVSVRLKTTEARVLLGVRDLVVAVGTGALSSGLAVGITGDVTTAPMAQLPLVLVPAYLVPLFIMLHLVALFQTQQLAASGRRG